jgi:4-amino-4-deoxy-L-arabinose transferase-like glycosyltransferase
LRDFSITSEVSLFSRPDRVALAIIAVFALLRLVLATTVDLSFDESYTVSVAHAVSLSYYDHPPLQYWIVHLFLPLLGDGRAARLPFVALFAGTSWLLYRLTERLFHARAGVLAVLAINCSGCFTFGLGTMVEPDGPLMFAMLAAALTLTRVLFPVREKESTELVVWLQAGFWVGLAALSKYHAVLFAAGVLLFLLSVPQQRRHLHAAGPWLGAVLALAIASPVFVWNLQHHWASFEFQGGRALPGGFHPGYVLANIAGQAIWLLPWVIVPLLIGAARAVRAGPAAERTWYCLCLGLPTIALFTLIPLWGHIGLPHWQMPGWLMLFPLLGEWAVRAIETARLRRFGIAGAAAMLVFAVGVVFEVNTGYAHIVAPSASPLVDPTLEMLSWRQLPPQLAARGLLPPGTFVITTSWFYAGKIDQALNDSVPVVVFNNDPRQYGLRDGRHDLLGHDAIVVAPVAAMHGIAAGLRPYFGSIEEESAPVALGRLGRSEIELRVLRAQRLRTPLPAPAWAH